MCVSAPCFPGCAPRNRAEGLVWSFLRQEDGEAHAEASASASSVSDRYEDTKAMMCFRGNREVLPKVFLSSLQM